MTEIVRPETTEQAEQAMAYAVSENMPVMIEGQGTKQRLGRPVQAAMTINTTALSGITLYEPEELVLSARAGTPLAEIEKALDDKNQMMAFEPADYAALFGGEPGSGTIGGLVNCNLAGSRRISQGAARDHVLGVAVVTGRGETIKSGGRVVKNVTGYDLSKLVTGSYGTLGLLTDVTIKVLPRPECCWTLMIQGLDDAKAIAALSRGLGSSHEVSGAAHLPADIAGQSGVTVVAKADGPVTLLRIEGPLPSVEARAKGLTQDLESFGPAIRLETDEARPLWAEVTNARAFAGTGDDPLWRISMKPTDGPKLTAGLESLGQTGRCFYDWGGGLVWFAPDAAVSLETAKALRQRVDAMGGHATLIRSNTATRQTVPVFHPQSPALGALSDRVKQSFDPKGLINPGRMTDSAALAA
ncbi:MAG: glycolate oxidase subunit GlcE [Magnetovibrionaceae bacterium]